MLKTLKIQNLLFIEEATLFFTQGLNILTGETGSGKSAILSAISLIAGERADPQIIGKRKDLAIVEGMLGDTLIRREIYRSGKNRVFINDALVTLTELRETAGSLIEVIDQASSHLLCSREYQRSLLNLFSKTSEEAALLHQSILDAEREKEKLKELLQMNATREKDLAWAEEDLAWIEKVNLTKEEEQELTEEHKLLSRAQELAGKASSLGQMMTHHDLRKALPLLSSCARIDPELTPFAEELKKILCELDELSLAMDSYIHRFESNPLRLEIVEKRIQEIDQLKRRFGKSFEEIEKAKEERKKRIETIAHLDEKIALLQTSIDETEKENFKRATLLSQKRKKGACLLEKEILSHLRTLNLPHAELHIGIEEIPLNSHGIDAIEFLFSANPDRQAAPIRECASGGEISRLFLSIKTALSEQGNNRCLVFDEIDGNVGGQTAVVLGDKLKAIATKSQVICVTHFVQVARLATAHFVVTKKQEKAHTVTEVSLLKGAEIEKEYERMLGSLPSLFSPKDRIHPMRPIDDK